MLRAEVDISFAHFGFGASIGGALQLLSGSNDNGARKKESHQFYDDFSLFILVGLKCAESPPQHKVWFHILTGGRYCYLMWSTPPWSVIIGSA